MEQHPVPQNVTTFQFRLIGDMTLKQFGYLCAGGVLAIISYKLPLPFFFTWPLAAAFGLLGIGFAFVPIEERPMDVWVFSFFKSIYSPTQYIWQKGQAPIIPVDTKASKVTTPLPTQMPSATPTPPAQPSVAHIYAPKTTKPVSLMDAVINFFTVQPKKSMQPTPPTGPLQKTPPPVNQAISPPTPTPDHKIQELETAISSLQSQLLSKNVADERIVELQKQLTDALRDKERSDDELIRLKRKVDDVPAPQPTNNAKMGTPPSLPTVRPFSSVDAGVRSGIPRFTSVPNVITGIVKDDAGGFLPAILITVTNADGIPMRALKTNKLGQLAASTPLPNGTYVIEIEDPRGRFTFDRAQVTLNGSVVPALEIIAKSQKQVIREKLAQDIFGKPPM